MNESFLIGPSHPSGLMSHLTWMIMTMSDYRHKLEHVRQQCYPGLIDWYECVLLLLPVQAAIVSVQTSIRSNRAERSASFSWRALRARYIWAYVIVAARLEVEGAEKEECGVSWEAPAQTSAAITQPTSHRFTAPRPSHDPVFSSVPLNYSVELLLWLTGNTPCFPRSDTYLWNQFLSPNKRFFIIKMRLIVWHLHFTCIDLFFLWSHWEHLWSPVRRFLCSWDFKDGAKISVKPGYFYFFCWTFGPPVSHPHMHCFTHQNSQSITSSSLRGICSGSLKSSLYFLIYYKHDWISWGLLLVSYTFF